LSIAFVGIGSNLGNRLEHYEKAVGMISELPNTSVVLQSRLYETEPHGDVTGWYINGVVKLATEFSPPQLLVRLKEIEIEMGRPPESLRGKWVARVIDLDILLFNECVLNQRDIQIPHPEMHRRRFVLLPLSEIAGNQVHPQLGLNVSKLLARVTDSKRVVRLSLVQQT